MDEEILLSTFTTDSQYKLSLVGIGNGGPGTILKDAWIVLPGPDQKCHVVAMVINFETLVNPINPYVLDAYALVVNPELRFRVNRKGMLRQSGMTEVGLALQSDP